MEAVNNAKILVIPDIHTSYQKVEGLIEAYNPDLTVFLGDYFDQFYDSPALNLDVATWLKESLTRPNRIHLFGNHDLHYAYPNRNTICSGFTEEKLKAISGVLTKDDWNKLLLYYLHGDILFTHAGFHNSFLKGRVRPFIQKECNAALKALKEGKPHWVTSAGFSRGGRQSIGGLTWCDWREFWPIKGLSQVFGHTVDIKPRVKKSDDGAYNLCLDTTYRMGGLRHCAIIDRDGYHIHEI